MKNIKTGFLLLFVLAHLNAQGQEKALSLQEALVLARENNKGLKGKMLESESAKIQTQVANAAMLPTVNAFGNYSYYFDRQVIFMPGTLVGNEGEPVVDVAVGGKNAFNTYLSLNQPLVSETARRQIKSARLQEEVELLNVKDHYGDLTMKVTIAYYQALFIQESVRLNKQSLERNLRSLDDSRSLLLQGKSLKIDTLRNYIVVENTKTTVTHLQNQHRVILLQLRQLLGIPDDTSLVLTDSLRHDADERFFAAVRTSHNEAVQNRPDIQLHKMRLKLAESNLSQNRAERLPTLSLVAAYQIQAQSDDRQFDDYRWPKTSFVGLQANIPLFSGNRNNARIRQANVLIQKNQIELEDATEKAKTEIETLEINLKELVAKMSIHERTVQAAEINYRIVSDRYKNGLSSRLELADAELSLTEARLNQLHNVFHVKVAKLQLDKAIGSLQY